MKKAVLLKNGLPVVADVEIAVHLTERVRGLLGRGFLAPGCGMLLMPCSGIQTFFMKFSLDLICLDSEWVVRKIVRDLSPNRMAWCGRGTTAVLEIQSGWMDFGTVNIGDRLALAPRAG